MGAGHSTMEYSVFGIQNPFADEQPVRTEHFTDRYVAVSDRRTLKIRDDTTVKYKTLIHRMGDVDVFQMLGFRNDPTIDPLRSFLRLHGFNIDGDGIELAKNRWMYRVRDVRVYFSDFSGDREGTNLTMVAATAEEIERVRAELGLTERNLNYAEYLIS